MNANFRMTIFGFILLLSFFLSAHSELLEGKYFPQRYGVSSTLIREGHAQDGFWTIRKIALPSKNIATNFAQNRAGTLRAFLYHDQLYVEQSSPYQSFLISGNFSVPSSLSEIYFSDDATLLVPLQIFDGVASVDVIARMHLDEGVIEFIPK